MKNHIKVYLIALVAISVLFSSCKKDSVTKDSVVTYKGIDYDLTKGYIANLGEIQIPVKALATINEFAIFLTSSGLTMESYNPPTGTGNCIGIWLYSSSATEIVSGTYTFENTGEALTFFEGFVMLEESYEPLKSLSATDIESGTLKVVKDGNEYEFTFDGTLTNGDDVAAYFKGTLTTLSISEE